MSLDDRKWHQAVVGDPRQLSGSSTEEFLRGLIETSGSRWICIRDLDGAYSGLRGAEGRSLRASEFLNRVSHAVQYNWAFFFLYRKEPSISVVGSNDRENISRADVTVRLVDDQYFYVYTTDDRVYDYLVESYPDLEHKTADLHNLDIPN